MRHDTECPYCGGEIEINHDDGYEEDELHEQKCEHCLKMFGYETSVIFITKLQKLIALTEAIIHGKNKEHYLIVGMTESNARGVG